MEKEQNNTAIVVSTLLIAVLLVMVLPKLMKK